MITRLGHRDGPVLEDFGGLFGATVLFQSISEAIANPQLAARARRAYGLGFICHPQTRTNLVPPVDRRKAFTRTGYWFDTAWDPEQQTLEGRLLRAYARSVVEAQYERGATVLLSPSHALGGTSSRARGTDILLAEAAAAFVSEHLAGPDIPSEYWASIALDPRRRDLDLDQIVEAYAGISCAGYWIDPHCVTPVRYEEAEVIASLAHQLKSRTGLPVVASNTGPWGIALAASGIDGVLMSRIRAARDSKARPMIGSVFHRPYLRNFALTGIYAQAGFFNIPCDCGHHSRRRPPFGGAWTRHRVTAEIRETVAIAMEASDTPLQWILQRLAAANDAGRLIGARPLDERTWIAPFSAAGGVRRAGTAE